MTVEPEPKRFAVSAADLPADYPTHRHPSEFWEALGRAVATFGFLEETLGRAIFAFTATREVPEDEIEAEFAKWIPTLKRALSDPLGGLIGSYSKAVRANTGATISNLDDLIADLRSASAIRNVLCHGSWRIPDEEGHSLPLFVNKDGEIFSHYVDIPYLDQVRTHVVGLICAVMTSVTHMGFQFPGSGGPGRPVLSRGPATDIVASQEDGEAP
jgi:hypothetical protein